MWPSGNDTAWRAEDPEFESRRTCFLFSSFFLFLFECKVLMSQMSHESWVNESMSQIWKNKSFGRNNKIKHYFYWFCLLPSLLPAQGLFLTWNLARLFVSSSQALLDCEQSPFFFRFSRGSAHARASGEAARRAKRGRQPEKKKCLSHLAPSVSRVAIRVSRVLLDGLQKKERLLVV